MVFNTEEHVFSEDLTDLRASLVPSLCFFLPAFPASLGVIEHSTMASVKVRRGRGPHHGGVRNGQENLSLGSQLRCVRRNSGSRKWSSPYTHLVPLPFTAECPGQEMDIAFLIDGSGSIEQRDFRQMKNFVKALMGQFASSSTSVSTGR